MNRSYVFGILTAACGALPACTGQVDGQVESSNEAESMLASPARRPAHLDANFIEAPGGYVHRSCVTEVLAGETLARDGSVVRTDGSRRSAQPCAHARYDHDGVEARSAAPAIPSATGWLASIEEHVSNVSWASARWIVPAAPSGKGGQVVFLWNGISNNDGTEVIQPVLEWNYGGSQRWTMAAWDVACPSGDCAHSTVAKSAEVPVNVGDAINGYMYPFGNGSWFIGIDVNNGYATGLSVQAQFPLDRVLGGALEIYYVDSCNQLPASGNELFTDEAIYQSGRPIAPTWSTNTWARSPDCRIGATAGTTSGTLSWTTLTPIQRWL